MSRRRRHWPNSRPRPTPAPSPANREQDRDLAGRPRRPTLDDDGPPVLARRGRATPPGGLGPQRRQAPLRGRPFRPARHPGEGPGNPPGRTDDFPRSVGAALSGGSGARLQHEPFRRSVLDCRLAQRPCRCRYRTSGAGARKLAARPPADRSRETAAAPVPGRADRHSALLGRQGGRSQGRWWLSSLPVAPTAVAMLADGSRRNDAGIVMRTYSPSHHPGRGRYDDGRWR